MHGVLPAPSFLPLRRVLPDHAELAGFTPDEPIGGRRVDRGDYDQDRPHGSLELDNNLYAKGIKVSDAEMATLNIAGDTFHPEWNYTIRPTSPRSHELKHLFLAPRAWSTGELGGNCLVPQLTCPACRSHQVTVVFKPPSNLQVRSG
jgi:hypothetical protein